MPVSLCTPEGKNDWLVCCVLDLCSVFVYAKTLGLFNHMLLWINEWTIFFLSYFSVFICGFICMYMYTSRRTVPQYIHFRMISCNFTRVMSMTLITFENIVVFMCYSSACSGYKGWEWVGVCVWTFVHFCFSPVLAGLSALGLSLPMDMWWLGVGSCWHDRPVQRDWAERCRLRVNRAAFIFTLSWAWEKAAAQAQLFAHG